MESKGLDLCILTKPPYGRTDNPNRHTVRAKRLPYRAAGQIPNVFATQVSTLKPTHGNYWRPLQDTTVCGRQDYSKVTAFSDLSVS